MSKFPLESYGGTVQFQVSKYLEWIVYNFKTVGQRTCVRLKMYEVNSSVQSYKIPGLENLKLKIPDWIFFSKIEQSSLKFGDLWTWELRI